MKITDLEDRPLWVAWQSEKRGEKLTKIPYNPHTGKAAKSNDPSTWGTHQQATARVKRLPNPFNSAGVGILIAPLDDLHIGGVDLDACRDEKGHLDPWAAEIVERFASYSEISPSNTGVKIFFLYDPQKLDSITSKAARRKGKGGKDPGIEFYTFNRYFTVTGRLLGTIDELRVVPIEDMRWLHSVIIPNFSEKKKSKKAQEAQAIHPDDVAEAFELIRNDNLSWEDWNTKGLALFAATGGSTEGFAVFDKWSRKADVYDENATKERWEHYKSSPPDRSSMGSIVYWVREEDPDWMPPHSEARTAFERDKKGKIKPSQENLKLALVKLDVHLSYDTFQRKHLVRGPGAEPWRSIGDYEQDNIYLSIDSKFAFRPAREFFYIFLKNEARSNSFHPVRDYLDSLKWDRVPRIDTWLTEYAGANDTNYTRAVGAIVLTAAVRRVRQPGCKFDEMIVLESPQGQDKSTALGVLAVQDAWFTDGLPLNAEDREVIEILSGKWVVEASELKGMRTGQMEHLKAFLSRQTDRARMAYGREQTEAPRQCVIFGTTNSAAYLRDISGNRRFWPVKIGRFDVAKLARDRDQLWAEAAEREVSGASIRLPVSLYEAAAGEQVRRFIDDPWMAVIERSVGGYEYGRILAADLWTLLNIPVGMRQQEHGARLGEAMRNLGWEHVKLREAGRPQWHYAKGDLMGRTVKVSISRNEQGDLKVSTADEEIGRGEGGSAGNFDEIPE